MYTINKGEKMLLSKRMLTSIISLLFVVSLFAGVQNVFASGSNAVVETDWLEKNLNNSKVKIVFVDNWPSEKEIFMKKHVKGSVYMGIGALMGALGNGTTPPDKAKFQGIMHRLGINNGDQVVIYPAKGSSVFALSALWIMDYFGHKNLSYLNGGLEKWNKENRPSESGMKKAAPGKYKAASPNESIRADSAYVLKSLKNSNIVFVDARGTGEYKGDVNNDKNKRVGHIPGAIDLDSLNNFNADGTLKSAADLKAMYAAKGVTNDKEVITYCQAGIKASNAFFAIKHVLGYDNVKVYVGSWGEWGNRVDFNTHPIEK